jgi:Sulfotransferase family
MPVWPNFFIAGAPRCGTTSLHAWLQTIPGIYMSRIKEPNFFSRQVIADDHPLLKPIRGEKQYLQLFCAAGDAKIVGEASPKYLEDPGAPALIDRTVPGAKILVSLRDPVERYHSNYLMIRNNRPSMGSLMSEIERGIAHENDPSLPIVPPRTGLYAAHIERYRQIFGDARFKVVIFEEMMCDIPGTLRDILGFLGLDHDMSSFAEPAQREHGEARGPLVRYMFGNRVISRASEALIPFRLRKWVRNTVLVKRVAKPAMDSAAREFLVRYYRDDVGCLEALLGRRLPWRNFSDASPSRNTG